MDAIDPHSFWRWAYSNFLTNSLRGVLAEFIVGQCLGCLKEGDLRTEWDRMDRAGADIKTADGRLIEVKASGYLQAWEQRGLSKIKFDISRKQPLAPLTDTYGGTPTRASHVYVFAVFAETDRDLADPLKLDQWFFLVCPTTMIEEKWPEQKSITLSVLEAAGLQRLRHHDPREAISPSNCRPRPVQLPEP